MSLHIVKLDQMTCVVEGEQPTDEWLQKRVGGGIDIYLLKDNSQLIVNAEHALLGDNLPFNQRATTINILGNKDKIYGDAVVLLGDARIN